MYWDMEIEIGAFMTNDEVKHDLEGICQDCMYLEKIKPLFEEKDKEIDRLNKENYYYFKMNNELSTLNTSLRSDRDRLNNIINANKKATKLLTDDLANMTKQALEKDNIINELEKWLSQKKDIYETKTGIENNIAYSFSRVALDKLKALKEDNK